MVTHQPATVASKLSPLLVAMTLVVVAYGAGGNTGCANDCLLNGFCRFNGTVNNRCECNTFSVGSSFSGADCRFKACPTGKAWADFASSNDVAHAAGAVCSNKGDCDESSGVCACATGFTGPACERTHCPGAGPGGTSPNQTICSGHGTCLNMGEMAAHKDDVRTFLATTYALWDHDMIYGCICEEGFTGYDCALRTCIKGDDPLTAGVNEKQIIECTCQTGCSGGFRLGFRGEYSGLIPHTATAERVKHELEKMDLIRGVTVTFSGAGAAGAAFVCDNDGVSTLLEFTHNPGNLPDVVPDFSATLFSSGGTPTMSVVSGGANGANGGTTVEGTKENVECNNRGTCDRVTGYCTCDTNFASSNGAGAAGFLGDCGFQSSAITACAGATACNSQGTCSGASAYTCSCNSGFNGPSCQFKDCPSSIAWFDEAIGVNTAHTTTVECSNRGACDRTTGACTCMDGFTGADCSTFTCPGKGTPCSVSGGGTGGTCYTMAEMATVSEVNGDLLGVTYTRPWDATKIKGCDCKSYHHGPFPVLSDFDGYDCSMKKCPTGDDPSTIGGLHEVQTITCSATAGAFLLTFRQVTTNTDQVIDWPGISYNDNAAAVRTAILTMLQQPTGAPPYAYAPNDVAVVMTDVASGPSNTACSAAGVRIDVTFLTHLGDVPMMTVSNPSGTLSGSGSGVPFSGGTVTVEETVKGTRENAECGNQGICNRKEGTCQCLPGFDSSDGSGGAGLRGDCGFDLGTTDDSGFTKEVQSFVCTATGGTFTVTLGAATPVIVNWNDNFANFKASLESLTTIIAPEGISIWASGTQTVLCASSTPDTIYVRFLRNFGDLEALSFVTTTLTHSGTPSITQNAAGTTVQGFIVV